MGRSTERHILSSLRKLSALPAAEFDVMLAGVCQLAAEVLKVDDVLVCFGVRDRSAPGTLGGWRNVGPRRFGPNAERDDRILNQWYGTRRNQAADPSVQALIRTAGIPRALLHSEVADDELWRRSHVGTLLAVSDIGDRLVGGVPLTPDTELLLVAYRRSSQGKFGSDERDILRGLAARLAGVGRTIAHGYGLSDSGRPLSRREREVLQLLLRGLSESTAATSMGLTTRSFHQYVVSLYRRLGVHSRGELVARFLAPGARENAVSRFAAALNRRELDVLAALTDGLSEKETAAILGMSVRTVHYLIGLIYRKFGVSNRASLLAIVLSAGATDFKQTPPLHPQ